MERATAVSALTALFPLLGQRAVQYDTTSGRVLGVVHRYTLRDVRSYGHGGA